MMTRVPSTCVDVWRGVSDIDTFVVDVGGRRPLDEGVLRTVSGEDVRRRLARC